MKAIVLTAPDIQRFWGKVELTEFCWQWKGAKQNKGYGTFDIGDRTYYAHRVSYTIVFGPVPTGLFICHSCDNPGCVNPQHLYAGTHQDNMNDMVARHRSLIGEQNVSSKLKKSDVEEIRSLYGSKQYTQSELANMFCVDRSLIGYLVRFKIWKFD